MTSESSAIDQLTKEREMYRMRWLASEVDLRLALEALKGAEIALARDSDIGGAMRCILSVNDGPS